MPAFPIMPLSLRRSTVPWVLSLIALLLSLGGCAPGSSAEQDYPTAPVGFENVTVNDVFWTPRLQAHRRVTIPHVFAKSEETGRIKNFGIAAGQMCCTQSGTYPFDDTDVYKALEGAAYALQREPDEALEAYVDSLIALIGAAQEEDGYLYTWRTNRAVSDDTVRWSNLQWGHELYNAGHLYEAAAAHYAATGKRTLLDIALKNAALVVATFGPDRRASPPGHQEIELGLVKLYRVTGEHRYLDLAKFFLEARGHAPDGRTLWGPYAQDHLPLREQEDAVGHAVRAGYFYAALADIAALTGEASYVETLDRLWENVVTKKMYVTGGVGAVGFGERFGENYELPNLSAYSETCSSIAQVMWHHRMFLLHQDARYIDVMERTLYNALLAGISLEGNRFFYPNPLGSKGFDERNPWFVCSCCPTNLVRFLPTLPSYIYAQTEEDLYVNLFVGSEAAVTLGGETVRVKQETPYPWAGDVHLTVDADAPVRFTLHVRIPGWAREEAMPGGLYRFDDPAAPPARLMLNGEAVPGVFERGYLRLTRTWVPGDRIDLDLPMPARRVVADEQVEADRGRVALQRGPLVYALEGPDQADGRVFHLVLSDTAAVQPVLRQDLLNGVTTLAAAGQGFAYDANGALTATPRQLVAIPYYAWAHRGFAEMNVWLAQSAAVAEPLNGPSLALRSRASSSGGTGLAAVNAAGVPRSSQDAAHGAFAWSDTSRVVWIQYDFETPQEVSAVDVYWAEAGEDVRVPASWRVLAFAEGRWQALYNPYDTWGTAPDTFNRAMFETARTPALRLEVRPQPGKRAGVAAWQVY